jgi:putative membrane protein
MINGTCAILLIASLNAIKKGHISTHKKLNITAFILSAIFLISYLIFHSYGIETRFPAENSWRLAYLIVLISHIILAAIVLPLVFISFYFGLNNKIEKHRKIVRWSFPVWLYVTISGVIVYLMISPYYQF